MKLKVSLILCVVAFNTTFSQIRFEKGFFINNDNDTTFCLIKNADWKNNPVSFEYKLTENSEIKTGSIATIKEFQIAGVWKYLRAVVKIDLDHKITDERNSELSESTLFLKVLSEGEAKLYRYSQPSVERFLYSVKGNPIQQLIYKKYYVYVNQQTKIATNTTYQQQLYNEVNCGSRSKDQVKAVAYNSKSLRKFFESYNSCADPAHVMATIGPKRKILNLKLTPGINFGKFSIDNTLSNIKIDYGNFQSFRFGVDAEFILPYNNNKWALVIEPTFQSFHVEKEKANAKTASVNYQSIEVPLGVRHYFFLANDSKLFLNAFCVLDYDLNSFVYTHNSKLTVSPRPDLGLGGGIQRKKITTELRYYSKRNALGTYSFWNTDYSKVALIVGFYVF
jgi:hypothetical protein